MSKSSLRVMQLLLKKYSSKKQQLQFIELLVNAPILNFHIFFLILSFTSFKKIITTPILQLKNKKKNKNKKKRFLTSNFRRKNVFKLKFFHVTHLALQTIQFLPQFKKMFLLTHQWGLNHYLQSIFVAFFGFLTNWSFLNYEFLFQKNHFKNLTAQVYKKQVLQGLWCPWDKFLNWFLKLFYFKDPWGFITKVNKWITYSYLKKHKKLFRFLGKFLAFIFDVLLDLKKLRGFTMFFKGKLGKKGSVRKTKNFIKRGEVSYSTKNLRVNYRTFQIWTHTGVIGAGVSLFYGDFVYILFSLYYFLCFGFIFNFNIFFCLSNPNYIIAGIFYKFLTSIKHV